MRPTRLVAAVAVLLSGLLTACAPDQPVTGSAVPVTSSPAAASAPTGATPAPSRTADVAADLILRGDGLGPFQFGASQPEVSQRLTDQLGEPAETYAGIICELDPQSPWAETLIYGGLWVQFSAKDDSRKSPRRLSAWGLRLDEPLPAPLAVADGVPLNLGFAKLKARYPDGELEDLGLGDGSRRFILPNQMMFVGAETPDQLQAGQFSLCE